MGPDSIFFLKAGLGPFLIWMCGWQRHILDPEAGEVIGGRVKGVVGVKAIETEEPGTLFFFSRMKSMVLSGTPRGLMKFRRWTFFYEWADFFALQVVPVLAMIPQPLGVCIFLPIRLGVMRPGKNHRSRRWFVFSNFPSEQEARCNLPASPQRYLARLNMVETNNSSGGIDCPF